MPKGFQADAVLAREAGAKGGRMVVVRYGVEFLSEIGKKGGAKVRDAQENPSEYYASLGRKGGAKTGKIQTAKREAREKRIMEKFMTEGFEFPAKKRPGRPRKSDTLFTRREMDFLEGKTK